MTSWVEVRTGARLHFGLLDTQSRGGRQGGIGMMIDWPGWRLRGRVAQRDGIAGGGEEMRKRIERFLELVAGEHPTGRAVAIEVLEGIPSHRGLGSGTQLGLAVGRLLVELGVIEEMVAGTRLGRGERSLVGTRGFDEGGFWVDWGAEEGQEERVWRFNLPEEWRFLLVEPVTQAACAGEQEARAFERLAPMPREGRVRLRAMIVERIVPGLEGGGFEEFAGGVAEFNQLVGEVFAPSQGGIYAEPVIRDLADWLARNHWPYLAQSSWGCVAAIVCPGEEVAEELKGRIKREFGGGIERLTVAQPRNVGVEVAREGAV